MIDVKKLISGFLILAAAAIGSGVILSVAGNSSSPQTQTGPTITGSGGNASAGSLAIASAYTDTGSLQGNAAEMLAVTQTTSTDAAATDPNNLTNAFANSFLDGLVSANPTGVTTDQSGNLDFSAPDTQSVAASIASNPAVEGFTVPNWDAEAQSQVIAMAPNSSAAAVTAYNNDMQNVINKYFVSTNLQSLVSNAQAGDASQADYIATQLQGALTATLAIPTPPSLVAFQKSFVRVLVYEKNTTLSVANANSDPVKTALTLQGETSKYSAAISEFQSAEQSASSVGLSLNEVGPSGSTPLIAQLFGVHTAHAQWLVFDAAAFGQLLEDYLQNLALQILKNILVALLQKKVLTWIQGAGAPRFVTNFATQMVNSFQAAAVNSINDSMTCVPAYQAANIRLLLTTPNIAPGQNACAAEFVGQLNNNLNNFYNHFTNFNDFVTLLQGNAWTYALQSRDGAIIAGGQNQAAQQTKTVAQQGWSGSEVCDDNSNPQGTHILCQSADDPGYSYAADNGACDPGDFAEHLPNDGLCADGTTPQVTTPGQVTGQAVFTAVKSGSENVTSANSIAGILDALLSSLLNTLAQDAINFSNQAVNGALNGGGGGGGGGAPPPTDGGITGIPPPTIGTGGTTAPATPAQCFPATQTLALSANTGSATAILSAAGGAIDSTCALNNTCPANVNADGSPTYAWNAQGATQGNGATALTGGNVTLTYNTPGTYNVSVAASTDQTNATCQVIITPAGAAPVTPPAP